MAEQDKTQAGIDWLNERLAEPLPVLRPGASGEDVVGLRDAVRRTRLMSDLRTRLMDHQSADQTWQSQALAAINKEEG